MSCNSCGGGVVVNIGADVASASQVSTGNYTSGTQVERRDEVSGDKTFPAGAYYVSIKPVNQPIEVNGEIVSPGGHYHREVQEDKINKVQDFLPAISVVANGQFYWYAIAYPSSAGVTEADIANA